MVPIRACLTAHHPSPRYPDPVAYRLSLQLTAGTARQRKPAPALTLSGCLLCAPRSAPSGIDLPLLSGSPPDLGQCMEVADLF